MNFFLRNKLCRRFRRTKKGTTTTYINNRATMMPASSRTRRGYACEPGYFQTVAIIVSYARAEWATKQRKFLLLTNERSLNARPAYLGEARREPGRNYIVFASKRPSRQLAGCFYVRQSTVEYCDRSLSLSEFRCYYLIPYDSPAFQIVSSLSTLLSS